MKVFNFILALLLATNASASTNDDISSRGLASVTTEIGPDCFSTLSLPPEWLPGTYYEVGDRVTYESVVYEARQAHTSYGHWQPLVVLALWMRPTPCGVQPWTPETNYISGSVVVLGNKAYKIIQPHVSQSDWDPTVTKGILWELIETFDISMDGGCVENTPTEISYQTEISVSSGNILSFEYTSSVSSESTDGEATVQLDGDLVYSVSSQSNEIPESRTDILWAPVYFNGIETANILSTLIQLSGEVDGRIFGPIPSDSTEIVFQDGGPPPTIELSDSLAGAIAVLSDKVKNELEGNICNPLRRSLQFTGSEECNDCNRKCENTFYICEGSAVLSCIFTFGIGCVNIATCQIKFLDCQKKCNEDGGACCPVQCSGGKVCCNNNESCIGSGFSATCCDTDRKCGDNCCAVDQECVGGQCFNTCNSNICLAGEICADEPSGTCCRPGGYNPSTGVCCDTGTFNCGSSCCQSGTQRCVDAGASICEDCPVTCGGICCQDSQTCAGTTCCAPSKACGSLCCSSTTQCVNGACTGFAFQATVTIEQTQLARTKKAVGSGTLFTPNGQIRLEIFDAPKADLIGLGIVARADSSGNFSFQRNFDVSIQCCTADEAAQDARAVITDVDDANQRTVEQTLSGFSLCADICR